MARRCLQKRHVASRPNCCYPGASARRKKSRVPRCSWPVTKRFIKPTDILIDGDCSQFHHE
jgi:hypothetical protein